MKFFEVKCREIRSTSGESGTRYPKMLFRLLICRLVRVNLNRFLIGKMYMLLCVLFLYIWVYITDCIFVFCTFLPGCV